jgi:hypothetical protein
VDAPRGALKGSHNSRLARHAELGEGRDGKIVGIISLVFKIIKPLTIEMFFLKKIRNPLKSLSCLAPSRPWCMSCGSSVLTSAIIDKPIVLVDLSREQRTECAGPCSTESAVHCKKMS